MKPGTKSLMAAVLCGLMASSGCGGSSSVTCSFAGGTPLAQAPWPKFRHDLQNTGFAADVSLEGLETAPEEQWRFGTGGAVASSPVVAADGEIYVGSSDGNLYAIIGDTGAGDPDWKFCVGGSQLGVSCTVDSDCESTVAGTCQEAPFPTNGPVTSTPLLDEGGLIFVASGGGNVYGLKASDGTIQRGPVGLGSYLAASPTLSSGSNDTGALFVGSLAGSLIAICPNVVRRWARLDTSQNGSPALAQNGTIYEVGSGSGRSLQALRPDTGTVMWSFGATAAINASPVVGADGTIYIVDSQGKMFAVLPDGTRQAGFSYDAGISVSASPAVGMLGSQETIYVADDGGHVAALDPQSGTPRWTFDVPAGTQIGSSPLVTNDGTIIFGADDGNLYALHDGGADQFEVRWTYSIGARIRSSPAIRQDGGGTVVYVGADDGNLYALRLQ